VRIETTTGLFEQTVELHTTPADARIAISEPAWAIVERNVLRLKSGYWHSTKSR
jgi:hypothetical protein